MKPIQKNKFRVDTYIFFILLIFAFLISKSVGLTMPDDGWRHLAMALNPEDVQSWGRIYPFTLYNNFDPWFMWHNLLSFIARYIEISNIHIVVNTIVYSLLSFWYYLAFSKLTNVNKIFSIIFAIGLPLFDYRYFYLRPDLLSGLFILYFLICKNRFILILTTLLYAPFYYVFWFYFGYLAYIHIVIKEYNKSIILFFGLLFGLLFYLSYDFDGYIQISQNVLNNDVLTSGYSVGESEPFIIPQSIKTTFGSSVIILFLILFSLLCIYVFRPKDKLLKYLILFLPIILIQYRFVHLLQPLIYVFFIHITFTSFKIIEKYNLNYFFNIIKEFLKERTYFFNIPKKTLKSLIILTISIFFFAQYIDKIKQGKQLENNLAQLSFLKDQEFKNKRILFSAMGTSSFMSVFLNPTAEYIPSCSLGWVTYNKENKKTYFDLLTNNDKIGMNNFFIFLKRNNPDYFIIDTRSNSNLKFTNKLLEINSFEFYKIINAKLIFRKTN